MFKVVKREEMSEGNVILNEIEAPKIARKALPGQFVILKANEDGEREHPLFAGRMLVETLRLDGSGDHEQVLAILSPWMYGDPLEGELVWNSIEQDTP